MDKQGYLKFEGIDCIFSREENNLYVIPKNKQDFTKMHQFLDKKNFLLKYEDNIDKNSYFYIKEINIFSLYTFCFIIKYTFNLIGAYKVSGFILTGDDIDIFFNPTSYFYKKHVNNIPINIDLLYNKEIIKEFNFTYLNKNISILLYYGDILSKGIASDLTLHPKLKINFEETEDIQYIFKLYEIIIKFIQIVMYQQNHNIKPAELIGPTELSSKSKIGLMYDRFYKHKYHSKYNKIEYVFFELNFENILQLISNNPDYSIRHLPMNSMDIYKYDVIRYMSIFSAFEYECSQNPEEYKLCDDTEIKEIKNKILDYILKIKPSYIKDDNEKNFINEASRKISELGKQFGQKNKIINAYYKMEHCLNSSIDYIFIKNDFEIKKVAVNLSNLRQKIVHDNLYRELYENEIVEIRFLEILTYCLFLNRAGVDCETIELIIGSIFHCNFKYMDFPKNN